MSGCGHGGMGGFGDQPNERTGTGRALKKLSDRLNRIEEHLSALCDRNPAASQLEVGDKLFFKGETYVVFYKCEDYLSIHVVDSPHTMSYDLNYPKLQQLLDRCEVSVVKKA